MKKIEYVCDKCGKVIDKNGLYSISPCRLDPEHDGLTAEIPDEISDELFEQLDDKHLCLGCLKRTLKFFNGPAVINPEFEKEVFYRDIVFAEVEINKATDLTPTSEIPEKKNNKSRLSEEELREMVNSGMSAREIADTMQMDISGIYAKIKKYGIQLKPKKETSPVVDKTEKTKLEVESVKEAYFSGKTIPEVASQFGVSQQEMRNFLIRNRISKNAKEYSGYLQQRGRVEDLGV